MTQKHTHTHTLEELLRVTDTTAMNFGIEDVAAAVQADLDAHNAVLQDIVADFAGVTTEREMASGGAVDGEMVEVDSRARSATQGMGEPGSIALPLRDHQFAVGFEADFLRRATPAQIAVRTQQAQKAHINGLTRGIRNAIFNPTDYTFRDRLVDRKELTIRALVNGDGQPIITGPNGENFDPATHTHYNAVAGAPMAADVDNYLISEIAEHQNNNVIRVYINRGDLTTFEGVTSFKEYQRPGLVFYPGADGIPQTTRDITRTDNRAVGMLGDAELWTKPWIPQGYALAVNVNAADKPLMLRNPTEAVSPVGLYLKGAITTFPLQAQYMHAAFGFGAYNRTAAAILKFGGGSTVYAAPTF